jgi:hypothetical protein
MKLVYDLLTEINVLTQRRWNHLPARGKNKKGAGCLGGGGVLKCSMSRSISSLNHKIDENNVKNAFHTSEETHFFSITKTGQLMLCR